MPEFTLSEVCHRLYAEGLVHGCAGNVSERYDGDGIPAMRITSSGACLRDMQEGDVTIVSLSVSGAEALWATSGPAPSSEWRVHRAIYNACPNVGAIVHAHPSFATAFTLIGDSLEGAFLSEMTTFLGPVPLAAFEPPGSEALGSALASIFQTHSGALLANHGVFAVGVTPREAFFRMTMIEAQAKTLFIARQLGAPRALTPEQTAKIQNPALVI